VKGKGKIAPEKVLGLRRGWAKSKKDKLIEVQSLL